MSPTITNEWCIEVLRVCVLICLLLGVSACSILSPQQERSRFFLLTPVAEMSASTSKDKNAHEVAVGVGPIDFPGYLKRPEVVTRDSDKLELSEDSRWAEPLDSNFQRVLAQDLSRELSTQKVVLFPWFGNPPLDFRVEAQVHRFDTGSDGQSQLSANWLIKDGRDGRLLFMSATTTSASAAAGDANASAGLSRALEAFSEQIATQIQSLEQARAETSASDGAPSALKTTGRANGVDRNP